MSPEAEACESPRARAGPRRPRGGTAAAFLAVSLVAAGALPSAAQTPPALPDRFTPAEAVRRALATYPEAGVARAEAREAGEALAEAEAGLLPRIDLLGSVMRFSEPMVVTPIHRLDFQDLPEFDETLIQGDLRLEHTLYDGGAARGAVAAAEARAGAAGEGAEAVEQALAARTLEAYLRVLGLDAVLAAADRRIEAVSAERGRVAQLLEVGRAPEVDLFRAEAALAAARADRVRVATALETAERELARLVGAEAGETAAGRLAPVALAGDAVELPPRQALEARLEETPAVARARAALAAAEAALEVARGTRRPRLALVGDVKEYGSSDGHAETEWNAGLQVAVPVFRGGALAARAAEAGAARDAAAERLRLARLEARRELDRALASLAEARARSEALEVAVAQYEEVVRVEALRLEAGAGVQADYLDAEAKLLDARAAQVEAGNGVIGARIEIARVTGELGPAWVEGTLVPREEPGEEEEP
ncbi:MAG TPA: TolC family protein [Thermoanaerobaculia bacterium]